jgi:hypothetical protein
MGPFAHCVTLPIVSVGQQVGHFVGQRRLWPTVIDVGQGLARWTIWDVEIFFANFFETFFVSVAYDSKDDIALICS